jgi:hypothetical protein
LLELPRKTEVVELRDGLVGEAEELKRIFAKIAGKDDTQE